MRSHKIIRLILAISLVLCFGVAYRPNATLHPSPSSAYAQEKAKELKPPSRSSKSPTDEEDQEVLNGQGSISVSVGLVNLQVLVTDTKGNIITGLKPENFTIYEDNVKQEISHYAPIEAGITAVMLVEFSNNIAYFIDDVWNAIYTFAGSMRKEDWVAVVGYDLHTTILCDFTRDRRKVEDALRRLKYPTFHESNLSDALIEVLDRTQEIDGKVAVILVSTGLDTFSRHTYDDALKKCKEANASVYAISVGQNFRIRYDAYLSSLSRMDLLMGDNRLRAFADYTGGMAFFPRFQTELPSIVNSISEMLRNQYSIAYVSTNTKRDGKFRKIKVEVQTSLTDDKGKPLKLKVRTRSGYIPKEP
jgi:VWFA-related protein